LISHRVRPVWRVLAGVLALPMLCVGALIIADGFPRTDRALVLFAPMLGLLFAYVAWTGRVPGWFAALNGQQATDD